MVVKMCQTMLCKDDALVSLKLQAVIDEVSCADCTVP